MENLNQSESSLAPDLAEKISDPNLPVEERLEILMQSLTLKEKVRQMMHETPAVERLGIPAYDWWNEACHGVGRAGSATVFPQVIGMAASWDRELMREVAEVTATEAIAKHQDAKRRGWRGQYRGLTFWTPNVNIFRDPRWGRGQETFGEDPLLTSELATEIVKGLQGDDPERLKTAACAKHYAVHSGPESLRHEFDAVPTAKDLWETYLPAFKSLVDTGVEAVMGAYNRTYGQACCASTLLIDEILRDQWGFQGHFVSDCGAIDDFHLYHGVTETRAESAALAIRNGCDLNCGCTYTHVVEAIESGLLTEEEVDRSVRRLLRTKLKLGLLDRDDSAKGSVDLSVVESPAHRALAKKAALESIVLLKNQDKALPLDNNPERVLVVGPCAANVGALIGNYHGISANLVTILQGVLETLPENTAVKYRPGCPILSEQAPGVNYTFDAAEKSDYVVAVMGLDQTLEGEEGDTVASTSGGDRDRVELPQPQIDFIKQLRPYCKKLVVVLTGGGAMAIPEIHKVADAVMLCWYPGCEGGRAVADVLFGKASPSGKLPISVPFATSDLPPFEDYSMQGRTYKFLEKEPLYPFGFGLSYGELSYEGIPLDSDEFGESDTVIVETIVRNPSDIDVDEVVQCYSEPPQDWPLAPKAQLLDFQRVTIPSKSEKRIRFEIPVSSLALFSESGEKSYQPGSYAIVVASSSPSARSEFLGACKPVRNFITLKA
ncbi:glycoside hydrolase family 3 C-terminal domain-containing protein [Pelagicoccus albus]|uniref:Glycoside hydrolase family 3 C-terminal domain-containing protein n=1 Tax=Pelagicoccus albus TaxID=415222 RepID=A0A7X1B6U8_9BACT|nr:glycoside hydrolase family 3 N-terminal domain-containing protein [Pelagicoccus albus]MBC2606773.1 glycoside hydrolase family 3 C-terminal domain-containing protein [Pelagicoccus albus]